MVNKDIKSVIAGTEGAYVRSPDGTLWEVTVDNTGKTATKKTA